MYISRTMENSKKKMSSKIFIYLFLAVLRLPWGSGLSLVAGSRGTSPVVVCGLLTVVASLVAEDRLYVPGL